MFSLQFSNKCRLCVQDLTENSLAIDQSVIFEESEQHIALNIYFVIDFCLDLNLSTDDQSLPRKICVECLDRLRFIFEYKQFCKQNNDQFFRCKVETTPDLTVIKEEPKFKEEDDDSSSLLVEVFQENIERVCVFGRQNCNERAADRSMKTAKERAAHRAKIAEQKRNRRAQLQRDDPEAFAKLRARETEQSRLRRQANRMSISNAAKKRQDKEIARLKREKRANESPEERAVRLEKSARQARLRRQRLKLENPEKYEEERAREAQRKRLLRASNPEQYELEKARDTEKRKLMKSADPEKYLQEKAEKKKLQRLNYRKQKELEKENQAKRMQRLKIENPKEYQLELAIEAAKERLRKSFASENFEPNETITSNDASIVLSDDDGTDPLSANSKVQTISLTDSDSDDSSSSNES